MTSVHPDTRSILSGGASSIISGVSETSTTGPLPDSIAWIKRRTVSEWEVFFFMMAMVMGAQYRQWNYGLNEGYWISLIKFLYVGSNYVCSALCMAEIASALPFSGGIYGVVRATMGPFAGYSVACFEILMNISYVIVVVSYVAGIPAEIYNGDKTIEAVSIVVVYIAVSIICVLGGRVFWTFSGLIGATTVALVVMYVLGSAGRTSDTSVDFEGYCNTISWEYSFVSMITNRAATASAYRGIQYLPLFSEALSNPKVQVPRLMNLSMAVLVVSVISLLTTSCSQYPGPVDLSTAKEPLAYGFANIFGISYYGGVWLHLPGLVASSFGFVYCAGRQLYKISESTLLPKIFMTKTPYFSTPYVGFLLIIVTCGVLSLSGVYNRDIIILMESVTVISTAVVFTMSGISYFYFHYHLSELQRHFRSPLGIYGAGYAILTFSIAIVAGTFLKGIDGFIAGGICGLYLMGVWLFYYLYMKKHQHFSEEERELMFKAYLIRANRANRKRGGKRNKIAPQRSSLASGVGSVGTKSLVGTRSQLKSAIDQVSSHMEMAESGATKQDFTSPAEAVGSERGSARQNYNRANGFIDNATDSVTSASRSQSTATSLLRGSFSQMIVEAVSSKMQQMFVPLGSVSQEMMEYQQLAIAAGGGLLTGDLAEEGDEDENAGSNGIEGKDEENMGSMEGKDRDSRDLEADPEGERDNHGTAVMMEEDKSNQ